MRGSILFPVLLLLGCPTQDPIDLGDATPAKDSGVVTDSGTPDVGGNDGGVSDTGMDAGDMDAGDMDAGDMDAGDMDTGIMDAGSTALGDCNSAGECPGGACVELVPGGYRVCRYDVVEAMQCIAPAIDECCDTGDCAVGTCLETPITPYCGGPAMQPRNVCGVDSCLDDTTCGADQICVQKGELGYKVNACFLATCRLDADCNAEPGGRCRVFREPCCQNPVALTCVYSGDCASNSDCPQGHCALVGDRTICRRGGPNCPL